MGKANRTGRSKKEHSFFVPLELFIMKSDAWQSLGIVARLAYIEIAALYNHCYPNNGNLALSARQLADRLPISRATAWRAFQELEDRGFIVAVKPSGFNLKTGDRRATEWRLTRYRCDVTGDIPTKAFLTWKPDQKLGEIHFAASPQGHSCFTTEPRKAKKGQTPVLAALSRSREATSSKHDGFTTGPLLDSTIEIGDRESAAAALTTQAASALPDNQINPSRATARALKDISVVESLKPLRDFLDLSKLAPKPNWPALTQKRPVESFFSHGAIRDSKKGKRRQ